MQVEGKHIPIRHLDKPFWPQLGLTKGNLVDYYIEMAPFVLPHLRGRPLIMKPYPEGAGGRSFYRWALPDWAPPWLHRWPYQASTEERTIEMLVVDGLPELVWAAGQGCIELHPWLSRTDDPARPDLLLFDLDPGPGSDFAGCLAVANWLHQMLEPMGVHAYAKTSGRHGLHVLVPIARRYTFHQVRQWVRATATSLAASHPDRITLDKSLAARRGRVLIDYAQNGLGKSVVAPYSARATPQATVSAPLTWTEVAEARVRPEDFTLLTMPQRARAMGDLLAPLSEGQSLPEPVPGS